MGADIKPGDRVRVVIEGEVTEVTDRDIHLGRESRSAIFSKDPVEYEVTVEKIEPPVEVFKVGDTVRFKTEGSLVFTLGRGGYFDHLNSIWVGRHATFTSEHYEKVSIG